MDEQTKGLEDGCGGKVPMGEVQVTFDPGSGICLNNPNPSQSRCEPSEDGKNKCARGKMVWRLCTTKHGHHCFGAKITNVVPCVQKEMPDLKSEGSLDGKVWTWTWPHTGERPPEVFYEIFISYGPIQCQGHRRIAGLRESIAVDPSILLPPEPGGQPKSDNS